MSQCAHGMPSPASCVECMDEGVMPELPMPKRDGWPFEAQFEGQCAGGCTSGIDVGDKIVRMSDGAYRHVGACEKRRTSS